MELKAEPYVSGAGDFFDIPAAEQEITVDSNEQIATSSLNSQLIQNVVSISQDNVFQQMNTHNVMRMSGALQTRGPRVIMVQRAGNHQQLGSQIHGQPGQGLKAVKIITVPGQGAGGKPIKAAVIPMHMLQRGVKVLTSSGPQTIGPGGTVISSSGMMPAPSSLPRFLALRPASQVTGQPGGNFHFLGAPGTPIRAGTLIFSSAPGTPGQFTTRMSQGFALQQQQIQHQQQLQHQLMSGEDIENSMLGHDAFLQAGGQTGGGFFELSAAHPHAAAAHFARQASPSGRESEGEQDHVTTGLKTNGLRRYARCVCNKVKEKNITSYSEVADELVHEYAAEHPMIPSEQLHYIQKNIRRRVYDALNVLMALNVLQKEKKEIRWVGLPVNMIEECRRLEEEREKRQISLRKKTDEIQELILQFIAFKNLVVRNRINERYQRQKQALHCLESSASTTATKLQADVSAVLTASTTTERPSLEESMAALNPHHRMDRVHLPFLIVSTNRKAVIDCNISNDKLEYNFTFDQAFEVRDEVDTLKRMGLTLRLGTAQCTQEEYNQCLELIPPSLRFYVEAIYERRQAIVPDFEALHQQRRLFVETRLAEVATVGGGSQVSGNQHSLHHHNDSSSQHLGGSPSNHFGAPSSSFFGGPGDDEDEDDGVRQIQLQRIPTDLVPGDTQHYARTAASRGFVVPGGPGGLLRHRNTPAIPTTTSGGHFSGQAGSIHCQAVKMTVEGVGIQGDVENASATAAIAGDLRRGRMHHHNLFEEDDDDVDMRDDEEDEDDDDMEDVQDNMKRSP